MTAPPPLPDPPVLTRNDELLRLSATIASLPELAIDTEGDSLHHYGEKLCLLQLSWREEGEVRDVLVDPLARGIDLAPLVAALAGPRLLFHGADYDLRLLGLSLGFSARELFDTMIAAQYLGEPAIGLAALLGKHCGVLLDKGMQKADWSKRPLSPAMKLYAAHDTHHLAALVEILSGRLAELGRLEWHREACARLAATRPEPRVADPENDWRVKGSRDLAPAERAILREIWGWREQEAQRRDLPPFRVANNEALLRLAKLARERESVGDALEAWRIPLSGEPRRALAAALERGRGCPPAEWPGLPAGRRPPRPEPEVEARSNRLREARDRIAKELAIEPGVLAPRAALEAIAADGASGADAMREAGGLLGWQAALLAATGA